MDWLYRHPRLTMALILLAGGFWIWLGTEASDAYYRVSRSFVLAGVHVVLWMAGGLCLGWHGLKAMDRYAELRRQIEAAHEEKLRQERRARRD